VKAVAAARIYRRGGAIRGHNRLYQDFECILPPD
jgi:hypothetical protein